HRGVTGFIHVDPVNSRTKDRKGEVRSVDFKQFVLIEASNADVQRALSQSNLSGAVVQVKKGKASLVAETNCRGAKIQLRARTVIRPQFIPDRQWTVDHRGGPVICTCRVKGNRAICITQTCDASRRVVIVGRGSELWNNESKDQYTN